MPRLGPCVPGGSGARTYFPGPGPGGVGVKPLLHLLGDEVDGYPARPALQVAEDAVPVPQAAQHGLVVGRGFHPEQGHDVGHLDPFGGPEREHRGNAVGDLLAEQVTNCISSVFAFRSSERVEVSNVMALLGAEPTPDHLAVLRGLGNGECIFRDLEGRIGRIGIDLISDEMRAWLDTNPTRSRPSEGPPVKDTTPAGAAIGGDAALGPDEANGPAGAGHPDGTPLVAGATAMRGATGAPRAGGYLPPGSGRRSGASAAGISARGGAVRRTEAQGAPPAGGDAP